MTPRVALVTHDLSLGGGTASVVVFLYDLLLGSGRFQPEIISLATSVGDSASVRLTTPGRWLGGPNVQNRSWRGYRYRHVGAWFPEFEFQRLRPRGLLTEILDAFDIVQVVDGTPAWGCTAAECARPVALFTATTVVEERGSRLRHEAGFRKRWLQAMTRVNQRMETAALRRANHVFAESVSTECRLKELVAADRLSLAPPGVDTAFFTPDPRGRGRYILSVGRFSDPRKNVGLLLEAYARLRSAASGHDKPRLVLAGTAPTVDQMQRMHELGISDAVEIRVALSQAELAALYRRAGVFVLSSDEEGLGIVILEAMASGLPVISTACGGPATAVVEGETGFLVPVGDVATMADRLQRLLGQPALRARMGEAGRERAERHFSLAAAGQVYLRQYDRLVARSG